VIPVPIALTRIEREKNKNENYCYITGEMTNITSDSEKKHG
jgi:hypothetical protein